MLPEHALGGGFLASPEFRNNPYPFYRFLYSGGPVFWVPGVFGHGAWFVTGHAECQAVLKDNRFGKEAERVLPPGEIPLQPAPDSQLGRLTMLVRDPPDHTRLRGLVNQAFTPRMLERLRPRIEAVAEALIDGLLDAPAPVDLIGDYAFPLPITVIAEMLGIPPADREQFKAWSNPLARMVDPTATPDMRQAAQGAVQGLTEYFRRIIGERRREPRPDLITSLLQAHDQGDRLSEDELLATCRLLLVAGHETTVNLIGNGTLALLRHPEQRERLAAEPALVAHAVEELLRYDSPVQLTLRVAMAEVPLGGQLIPRGALLFTLLGAANRDPRQYAAPDELDVARENAGTHLAFGQGIHYCLGAPLARLEGQIAIAALLRRLPGLRLAGGELRYRGNITLRGLEALPVTVGEASS